MANPYLILDSVDVRRAEVAGSGRPLILQKFVIPPVRFKTTTRSAGGGVVDIDYMQKRIQPLEPAFMVFGIDPDLMPNLRLDPDMPPPQITGAQLRGPKHVHVVWD